MALKAKRRGGLRGVLRGVTWSEYTRFLRLFAERPGVRLTYDRGILEIMSPLMRHDANDAFLREAIAFWHADRRLPYRPGGSVTIRSRQALRGVEPDGCFWLANAPAMRGVQDLDLQIHPPPDLVIEVDVTNSAVSKFPIYAALGVPEVWHVVHGQIAFLVLRDGEYHSVDASEQVPGLLLADLSRFYAEQLADEYHEVVERFRAWCVTVP